GVLDEAIGLKSAEEAVAVRESLLGAFERASAMPPGEERRRTLSVTVVGGGFSGVEVFGELLSLASSLLRRYRMLTPADLDFHLVEAAQRILPEVSDGPGAWVVRSEEHTSELQSRENLVCRLLLEKKNNLTSLPLQNTTSPTP